MWLMGRSVPSYPHLCLYIPLKHRIITNYVIFPLYTAAFKLHRKVCIGVRAPTDFTLVNIPICYIRLNFVTLINISMNLDF